MKQEYLINQYLNLIDGLDIPRNYLDQAVLLFLNSNQLGDRWIADRTSFAEEMNNITRVYQEQDDIQQTSEVVNEYLFGQYLSILQEFGLEQPFTFQQLYYFKLYKDIQENYHITHISAFGDWANKFLRFDRLDGITNQGLANFYDKIDQSQIGEVVVHYSPTEHYRQAGFASPGDVLMLARKILDINGEVKIESRYVFLQHLSNYHRAQLLNSLQTEQDATTFYANQSVTELNPQQTNINDITLTVKIQPLTQEQRINSDPLKAFALDLAEYMQDEFGVSILQGIRGNLEDQLRQIINRYIDKLHSILTTNNPAYHQLYINTIRYMLVHTQIFHKLAQGMTIMEVFHYLDKIRRQEVMLNGLGGIEGGFGFDSPVDNSIMRVETQNKCEDCGKIFMGTSRYCDNCKGKHLL